MDVASAIEIYTTVFGWIMYDAIWDILVDTGMPYFAFFFMLVRTVVASYERLGAEEGADASIRAVELMIVSTFLVITIAATPWMDLTIGDLGHTKACGTAVPAGSGKTGTGYDNSFAAINGQTAQVPVWWYAVMSVSGGITNATIAAIPCTGDIRTLDYQVDNARIADPALRHQIQLFTNDCWRSARAQFLQSQTSLPAGTDPHDIDWPGSTFFQNTDGYYGHSNINLARRASEEIFGFPYNANRDTEYQSGFIPVWGRPECKDWWQDASLGLRARILATIDPTALANTIKQVQADNPALTRTQIEDAQIRKLFEPERSSFTAGSGGSGESRSFLERVMGGAANAGLTLDYASWKVKIYALKQLAPIGQSYLLMGIYMLLPFILLFSGFSIDTAWFASVALFALKFLTALWAVATWIDDTMIKSLGIEWWTWTGADNDILSGAVANYAALLLFLGLPAVWISMLGWIGFSQVSNTTAATQHAENPVGSGADKMPDMAKNVGVSGIGRMLRLMGKK